MAESERSEYPGILTKVAPGHAVDILNERVRQAGRLNTAIADWLQERSRLEEQYAAGLRRLARKNLEDADLGYDSNSYNSECIFSVPWTTITTAMDTSADSHSSLAHKIETDVERPLREFVTSNREMQAMTTVQGNLASLAKDIERAQQKTEKLQGKGEKAEANKVANASSDLDNARVQWDSQAPYVFESLQALDETRVNQMRDHLTQLQTLELDQVEKNRAAAEQCLNILLNVETQDEIKTFALKAVAQRPPPAVRSKRESFMPSLPTGSSSTPSRGGQASSGLSRIPSHTLATIPSNLDESTSQVSASNAPEPTKKSAFKGLKRIGTVMSRRSSKQPASTLPSTAESPERKTKSSPFGRLGRNKDSYSGSLEPPHEDGSSRRPSSPLRRGSEVLEPPESRHSAATSSRAPQLDPMPHINGTSSLMPPAAGVYSNGSHQGDLTDLEPPEPAQPEEPAVSAFPEPRGAPEAPSDNEGFSVPPQNLDPISQAEADAAAAGERSEPQYNVNIRSAPIQEEGADAALASMANKLQAPPPTSTRRAGTVRGRRDNRNSAVISTYGPPSQASPEPFNVAAPASSERSVDPVPLPPVQASPPIVQPPPEPSSNSLVNAPSGVFVSPGAAPTFSPFNPGSDPSSPVRPSSRTAALGPEHTGDNQSIRSGRSTASQGMRHPDLHNPGLSSSIVETVSAKFENGKPVTSTLIGEIALAFNPTDISSSFGHETIRLENFASLEKVAPNPAFITTIPNKEYEYSVNLGSITRTQIAFKYQILHTDDANTHIPLMLVPAYKIQGNQAMAIVSYSLAPNFLLNGKDSITLSNVMIALTIEGAKATSCQSKPSGTFNRDRNLIFWQLGDVTLRPGAEPEKLLARFATETEATGGSVEAKWELSGESAQGLGSPLSISMIGQADGAADPFADESAGPVSSNWKSVPLLKKLAAASYVAK